MAFSVKVVVMLSRSSSHLLRSILAKSEFDKGLVSPAAFTCSGAVPFSTLLGGPLCRCRERGSNESWVRPLPLLEKENSYRSENGRLSEPFSWRDRSKSINLRAMDLARDRVCRGPVGTRFIHHVSARRVTYRNRDFVAHYVHAVHFQNCLRSLGFICKLNIRQTLQRATQRQRVTPNTDSKRLNLAPHLHG